MTARFGGAPPATVVSLLLLGIALLAIGFRLLRLRESLWVDELHTAWVVSADPAEVAQRALMGNQQPLYFQLVRGWSGFGGMSECTLRWPSLMAGVALVPLLAGLIMRWTGDARAGLLVGWLAATNADFVSYADEARVYALLQLGAVLHLLVFRRLLVEPTLAARALFIIGGAALFYLHYTAALLMLAEGCAWFALRISSARQTIAYRPWDLVCDAGLMALCCLPTLPHLAEVAARRSAWAQFIERPSPLELLKIVSLPAYVLLPLAVLAALPKTGRQPLTRDERRTWVLVGYWAVTPPALAWMATHTDLARLFLYRYVITASPAPILFCGLCAARCPLRWRWLLFGLVAIAALADDGYLQRWRDGRHPIKRPNEDWRAAVHYLDLDPRWRNLPVLVHSGLIEVQVDHFERDERLRQYGLLPIATLYQPRSSHPREPLDTRQPGRLSDRAVRLADQAQAAWVLLRAEDAAAAVLRQDLVRGLQRRGLNLGVAELREFGGVTLIRLAVGPAGQPHSAGRSDRPAAMPARSAAP